MKNRHGVEYSFEQVNETTFKFVMAESEMKYMSMGGREGQSQPDMNDLGYFDPAGGPFVSIGDMVEGREINRIRVTDGDILIDVKKFKKSLLLDLDSI